MDDIYRGLERSKKISKLLLHETYLSAPPPLTIESCTCSKNIHLTLLFVCTINSCILTDVLSFPSHNLSAGPSPLFKSFSQLTRFSRKSYTWNEGPFKKEKGGRGNRPQRVADVNEKNERMTVAFKDAGQVTEEWQMASSVPQLLYYKYWEITRRGGFHELSQEDNKSWSQ